MALILDREAMRRVFGMREAIVAGRLAFESLARAEPVMPERIAVRIEEHDGTQLSMPCYVPTGSGGILNVKVASVYPRNPERGLSTTMAFLVLQDAETGELLALMDAEHLTAMRTGAGCALATDALARADAKALTVVGAGSQAFAQVEAVAEVRPIEKVFVHSRSDSSEKACCERVSAELGIPCSSDNLESSLAESDIVSTATSSSTPVVEGKWLRPGTHINAVGSFRADMAELDQDAVRSATVVVDHLPAAQRGAGDLIQADIDWSRVSTLGEILTKQKPGRTSDEEITLFKSVGVAVQDAFAAAAVYQAAREQGLGQPFSLEGSSP